MSHRAYVEDDYLRFRGGVKIHLVEDLGHGRMAVAQFQDAVMTEVEEPAAESPSLPLALPEAAARAIYEALARHFGGAPDMHTLRKDYDAERARVDRFIAHAVGEARG
jgi:uncharacterized protein (DUF1501 family)